MYCVKCGNEIHFLLNIFKVRFTILAGKAHKVTDL